MTTVIMILCLFFALLLRGLWENTALEVNKYTICSNRLPEAFSGYRIAHISDLHNALFGEENTRLLTALSALKPDIIAITGDFVDSRRTDIDQALRFAAAASRIAPCFYVPGNHEARLAEYELLKAGLSAAGITVMEDSRAIIERCGEHIALVGVSDPSFKTSYLTGDSRRVISDALAPLMDEPYFTVLLSHRPELFDVYCDHGTDIALAGHAHGGQFRLPKLGGVFAPNQGFFPRYDSGIHTKGQTNMLVSRGLGSSIIPLRLNNRPEPVLAELKKAEYHVRPD